MTMQNLNKTIAITGLGWLGLPLAQHFITAGHAVRGSVTSKDKAERLAQLNIGVFVMEISESGIRGNSKAVLHGAEILIIMIPPGLRRNTGANYVRKMKHYLEKIIGAGIPKVVLISSTSVYGDSQGEVSEQHIPQPDTEAGKQLLEVEQLFFTSAHFDTTIVRFGGLLGGTRQPAKYLSGRKNLQNGKAPVNLIHRGDCIAILSEIVRQDKFGHIFNAVNPAHPNKEVYYTKMAAELDLELPHYAAGDTSETYKKVHATNLQTELGYKFSFDIYQ